MLRVATNNIPKEGSPTIHRTIAFADHHKSVFVCATLDTATGEIEHRTMKARRFEVEPFLRSLEGPVLLYVEACRGWE